MHQKETLPPAIAGAIKHLGEDPGSHHVSLSSDINLAGQYAPQWLVVLPGSVLVFDEKTPAQPHLVLPVADVQEFRTTAVVGSGLLQARVGGAWVDVVRYSNRRKYQFGRLAKRLEQLRGGQAWEWMEEDDIDPRRCPTCGLVLSFPGETCPRCIKQAAAVFRIIRLMKPYWPAALLMMTLLVGGIALDMMGPRLTGFLVDGVLRNRGSGEAGTGSGSGLLAKWEFLRNLKPLELLLMVVGTLAVVQLLRAAVNMINGRVGSKVGTQITYDIRGKLVDHLQQLSISYYDKQQTGSLVGRVAYDTEAVQGFISQITGGFLMQILLVASSAIMMFSMDYRLAFWTLLPAPFVLAGTMVFYRFVYPRYNVFWDRSSKQAGMLSGILSGIRVVKSFAQEKRELERFDQSSTSLRDARHHVDLAAHTFYPLMGLVFQIGGWLVWYFGGQKVLANDPNMTLGKLMAFFGYLGFFYGPLSQLTHLTSWLTHFSTQTHRIFEILDTPITIPETKTPVDMPKVKGEIEFRNVTFGYSRQTPVLKNVSFKIGAGEAIGVVGRSGSGKTTVINLISRFYDVDDGNVLIDGVDVRQITKTGLRRNIGVVLQEPFLFRGTIWDNLVYGEPGSAPEKVIAASRAGNCHDFILKHPHAYDTWVGERGAGLSGGERQRISIARALLCEPGILILDEATSSVDAESELSIQNALNELIKGRTSIIIAHRLSTLRNCNQILVIDDGRLVEHGSHEALMTLDGRYAKLVRIQGMATPATSVDELTEREKQTREEVLTPPDLKPDEATGLTSITAHRPRWLDPRFAKIHLGNHSALHVTIMNERIYNGVFAIRCVPVRHPSSYISLRWTNAENREQEVGLIRHLSDWPEETQLLIRQSLLRRYFIHYILGIKNIKQFQNFLELEVETDHGPMAFIMRYSSDSAQEYGHAGKIIIDLDENRYLIEDMEKLPRAEREWLQRYIYW